MLRLLMASLIGLVIIIPVRAQNPPVAPEATAEATEAAPLVVDLLKPEVISTRPHDTSAYTQGLVWFDGVLYESAGQYGESSLRRVDPLTGEVLQRVEVAPEVFAEGLALVDDRLIQITWKEEQAFVYDRQSFEQRQTFTYSGEGWGLCYDGEQLWMSDGSEILVTRDPTTFEVTGQLPVTFHGHPLSQIVAGSALLSSLNELECVEDVIYANVYLTDYILRIEKATGRVTGVIEASDLLTPEEQSALHSGEVLNGIAYDPEAGTFLITGKHWPRLFEVRFTVIREIAPF